MILVGDCVERLRELEAGSVDAVVCDPPYGLEFMGKDWDRLMASDNPSGQQSEMWHDNGGANPYARRATPRYGGKTLGNKAPEMQAAQVWHERWAREALRVLKPGGHLLAFGGTRTYHRLACAIEDAGFEIRDTIMWLSGQGFPKSLDVSKAIDRGAGAEREKVAVGSDGAYRQPRAMAPGGAPRAAVQSLSAPVTPEADRWQGWGTALKPAHEPVVIARKPFTGNVAGNVLKYGTGALNIDGCRVGFASASDEHESKAKNRHGDFDSAARNDGSGLYGVDLRTGADRGNYDPAGRWPANVVLSHSEDCVQVGERRARADGHSPSSRGASGYGAAVEGSSGGGLKGQDGLVESRFDGELVGVWACVPGCPVRMLDEQSGDRPGMPLQAHRRGDSPKGYGMGVAPDPDAQGYGDSGGASRFFYCAKASRAERNAGLGGSSTPLLAMGATPQNAEDADWSTRNGNPHPTVKPIELMRWLVRLVTPPAGRVLDPFAGSGTTGIAAVLEGFEFVGIERDEGYARIAEARIGWWREHPEGLPTDVALAREGERRRVRESGQLGLLD